MKVVYIHQYFGNLNSATSTRSFELARYLIASGHQVHLITSSAFLRDYSSRRFIDVAELDGIPATVIRLSYANEMPYLRRMVAFFAFALIASLCALFRQADVVFASSTPLTVAVPGMIASRRHAVPFVFEVRDLWPEMAIACGALRNPLSRFLARWLEKAAYKNASRIIALSPAMVDGVMAAGQPQAKIAMIPNACDIELFSVGPQTKVVVGGEELPIAPDQSLIVYTGTMGQMNDVSYLVRIADQMRRIDSDIRFLLVGDGKEWSQVQALALQLGVLDQNLFIRHAVAKRQIPTLLARATVVACVFKDLPEACKNSANKFFDALAAAKPLAINYGGWHADLLQESGAGIVISRSDASEAAQALADLVHDQDRLERSATAAHELALRFSRDKLAAEFELVLIEAVNSKRREVEKRRVSEPERSF